MKIDIEVLKNINGIGKKTLDKIIHQQIKHDELLTEKCDYIPSNIFKITNPITLWQGDSVQISSHIPSGYVDMIIVDPPYGISHRSNRSKNENHITKKGIVGDTNNNDLLLSAAKQCKRVLKPDGHLYWFCSYQSISTHLPLLEMFFNLKNIIIWDKQNHGSGDLKGSYANRYEIILFMVADERKELNVVNGKQRHQDILAYPKVHSSKLLHPHQKPVELLEFLIQKSSNEGDVVADIFMGSGSTGVAAYNTGRHFVGIEICKQFFQIAQKRVFTLTKQA